MINIIINLLHFNFTTEALQQISLILNQAKCQIDFIKINLVN